jgi:hypothetical protein
MRYEISARRRAITLFLSVGLLCLASGCATQSFERDQTVDLVALGNKAVETSRSYYKAIGEKNAELIRMVYVGNPECPLGDTLLLRRRISDAVIAQTPDTLKVKKSTGEEGKSCRQVFTDSNQLTTFCASDEVKYCRQLLDEKNPSLVPEVGTYRSVAPLQSAQFAASLELIGLVNNYIDILAKIALREDNPTSTSARIDDLMKQINVALCRFDASTANSDAADCKAKPDGSLPDAIQALKLKADVGAAVTAAANLFDFLKAIHDDVQAAKDIKQTLLSRGPAFEKDVQSLILDLENKRKAYMAFFAAELLDMTRSEWQRTSVSLGESGRGTMFDQYWKQRTAVASTNDSPAEPARLLQNLLTAHTLLAKLFTEGPDEKQRSIIARQTRDRLVQGFDLAIRAGTTIAKL